MDHHNPYARRSRRILVFTGIGVAACVAGLFLLLTDDGEGSGQVSLGIVSLLLALLMLIVGMLSSRKVYAQKITKEYARLGGCKEPFLASLERSAVPPVR